MIIKSDLDQVFCAGGDIRECQGHTENDRYQSVLLEYQIINLISNYPIPYVALFNGLTMGAGAGLVMHGKHRVATEKTVFAMPEAMIGMFTDSGASYVLTKLTGRLGLFMGLTGHRLIGSCLQF